MQGAETLPISRVAEAEALMAEEEFPESSMLESLRPTVDITAVSALSLLP